MILADHSELLQCLTRHTRVRGIHSDLLSCVTLVRVVVYNRSDARIQGLLLCRLVRVITFARSVVFFV